ncbi:MAG TPA: hypothetical protein VMT50_04530 [Steroidobacteraceae bacterium]|nr:hypothetical protein [Steroidobacteraceae bacterium]
MRKQIVKSILMLAFSLTAATAATNAMADEWPMTSGDFWSVTGIHLKDGGALGYANWLASEWKAQEEFSKSKGWIKNYMILGNTNARKGEPDLYLIEVFDRIPTGPESDKRNDEYVAFMKKSQAQMQKESGNRLEFREVGSNLLLQEMKFKK